MIFKFTTSIGDGLIEAPSFEEEIKNAEELLDVIYDEAHSDHGELFGPGMKIVIERIS